MLELVFFFYTQKQKNFFGEGWGLEQVMFFIKNTNLK